MSKSPGLEGLFAKFALGTCYYSCSQGDLHKPTFDRCYSFVRGGRGNLVPMFTPRPAHFVAFFIALAVAGCAITGDQPAQNSTGAAPSRPKTVLVYDLEFSPDIAVVDREFTVRLAREMGDISVSNQIVAKRVREGKAQRSQQLTNAELASKVRALEERIASAQPQAPVGDQPIVLPPAAPQGSVPSRVDVDRMGSPILGQGFVDIWNLNEAQLDQMGPTRLREHFEKILELGRDRAGAPRAPQPGLKPRQQ